MKKSRTAHHVPFGTGNIRKDLTKSQLAGLGAAAIAFNEAEAILDLLLMFSLRLHPQNAPEVTSRINGLEGKVEIAKAAMRTLKAANDVQNLLSATLGDAGFLKLKQYRDGVIHAYGFDVPTDVAQTSTKRGKAYEVLVTPTALKGLYDRLVLIRNELWEACTIAATLSAFELRALILHNVGAVAPHSDAGKWFWKSRAQTVKDIQAASARYRRHQTRRLSLPPLPEFPAESELWQARRLWLTARQETMGMEYQVATRRLHPAQIGWRKPRRLRKKS